METSRDPALFQIQTVQHLICAPNSQKQKTVLMREHMLFYSYGEIMAIKDEKINLY